MAKKQYLSCPFACTSGDQIWETPDLNTSSKFNKILQWLMTAFICKRVPFLTKGSVGFLSSPWKCPKMCFAMFTFGAGTGGHGRSGRIRKIPSAPKQNYLKILTHMKKKTGKSGLGWWRWGWSSAPHPSHIKFPGPKQKCLQSLDRFTVGPRQKSKKKLPFIFTTRSRCQVSVWGEENCTFAADTGNVQLQVNEKHAYGGTSAIKRKS